MASTTIRVSRETHASARRLAKQRDTSLTEVVAEAVEQLERRAMLEAYNAAWARLKENPEAAAEFAAEMAIWDGAVADGLDEWPYEGVDELLADGLPETKR